MYINNDGKISSLLNKLQNTNKLPGNYDDNHKYVSWGIGAQIKNNTPLKSEMFNFYPKLAGFIELAIRHAVTISTGPFTDRLGSHCEEGHNYGDGGPSQLILDHYDFDRFILQIESYERDPILSQNASNIVMLSKHQAFKFLSVLFLTDIKIYDLEGDDVRNL